MNYYNVNGQDINAAQYTVLKKTNAYKYLPKDSTKVKALPLHLDETVLAIYGNDKAALIHDIADLTKKGLIRTIPGTGGALWAEATEEGLIVNEPSKTPLRVGYHRPAVSNSANNAQEMPDIMKNALQTLADTPLVLNEEMRKLVQRTRMNAWTPEERAVIKGLLEWEGPIYSEAFCDWRGRAYNQSGTFGSYTQSKINRAMLDAPEATDIKHGSREYRYMLTITESEYGVNDKNWGQILNKPITEPSDLNRYRAALAIKEVKTTGKTAYMMEQDASCSGAQFVAMLMGDTKMAKYTNLLPDSVKHDLYTFIVKDSTIVNLLNSVGITDPRKIRNAAKPVVMLSFYGSYHEQIALNIWIDNEGEMVENSNGEEVPNKNATIKWLRGEWNWDTLSYYTEIAQRKLDAEFPSFGDFKGRMAAWFASINDEDSAYFPIEWVTPNGWLIERNRTGADAGGTMPNFVHSLDAAVVHRVINQCAAEGITIKTVHDAFFTTPTNALRLREIVAQCYAAVIRETPNPYQGTKEAYTKGFNYNNTMLDNLKDSTLIGEVFI